MMKVKFGKWKIPLNTLIRIPSQFAWLAPKVREFFERKAFGETVDLDNPAVIRAISSNVASYVVIKEF